MEATGEVVISPSTFKCRVGKNELGERWARLTPDTVLRFNQLGIDDRAQLIATGIEQGVGAGVLGADAITDTDHHLVKVDIEVGDGAEAMACIQNKGVEAGATR